MLQSLVQYYAKNIDVLPPFGSEYKEISFIIMLSKEGSFLDIQDCRTSSGFGTKMLVPQAVKRSGVAAYPNCLWDNLKYVFGIGDANNQKQKEALNQKRDSFLNKLKKVSQFLTGHEEIDAVISFLESDFLGKLKKHPLWKTVVDLNVYVSFSIEQTNRLVCQEISIMSAALSLAKDDLEKTMTCLLTGKMEPVARLHPLIQGIYGAQGSGASLVSYNLESVESFGKEQGYNAPISQSAVFAYSTALNHLLESSQKIAFNEAMTVVFWSEKKGLFEDVFADFLKMSSKQSAALFLSRCLDGPEDSSLFFVNALSPHGARLSHRFSWTGSIGDLKKRIRNQLEDLKMSSFANEQEAFSVYSLLQSISPCRDVKYVQPRLAGEFLFRLLNGEPYPQNFLSILLEKLSDEEGVSHRRASLLKAYLNRSSSQIKIQSAFDPSNQSIGYLLGSLFAVLEMAQNQVRRKRGAASFYSFYKMASISPKSMFPFLLKRYHFHKDQFPSDSRETFTARLDTLLQSITSYPSNLSLVAQGEFAVGYYHKKQKMFFEFKKR